MTYLYIQFFLLMSGISKKRFKNIKLLTRYQRYKFGNQQRVGCLRSRESDFTSKLEMISLQRLIGKLQKPHCVFQLLVPNIDFNFLDNTNHRNHRSCISIAFDFEEIFGRCPQSWNFADFCNKIIPCLRPDQNFKDKSYLSRKFDCKRRKNKIREWLQKDDITS